jgi:hypothetical protein
MIMGKPTAIFSDIIGSLMSVNDGNIYTMKSANLQIRVLSPTLTQGQVVNTSQHIMTYSHIFHRNGAMCYTVEGAGYNVHTNPNTHPAADSSRLSPSPGIALIRRELSTSQACSLPWGNLLEQLASQFPE